MKNTLEELLLELKNSNYKMINTLKMKYQHHDLSKIQPNMNSSDYESLVNDIKLQGVLEPIVIFENKVLDGRHRQNACIELKQPVPVIELQGNYSKSLLSEYIRSKHMNRNLTSIQKQCLAFNYKRTTVGVSYKDAASRFGVSERSIKSINSLYNELNRDGDASDFDKMYDYFESGKVCHPSQFEWLNKRCSSFSNAIKQLNEYRDSMADLHTANEIDITEVNPETGEFIKKEENFFMNQESIDMIIEENKILRKENEELKVMVKQLINKVEDL